MAGIETRCDQRRPAKRPRRMGLCSEVADGGENLEDHPALATRYVRRKAPFQRANCPASWSRAALNLFHSAQTKSCLGHCITRGIGLRRQATILRLRGAVLFSRAEARPAREFGRARGVETLIARRFLPCLCAAQVFVQHGTMKLCGSTPVIAEECGTGTACPVGHALRRVENRSRVEARSAPTGVLIGVRLIGGRAGTPALFAPAQVSNRR